MHADLIAGAFAGYIFSSAHSVTPWLGFHADLGHALGDDLHERPTGGG